MTIIYLINHSTSELFYAFFESAYGKSPTTHFGKLRALSLSKAAVSNFEGLNRCALSFGSTLIIVSTPQVMGACDELSRVVFKVQGE